MVLHEYSVEQTTGTHLRAQHLGETRLLRRIDLRILYCNSLSLSLSPLSLCLCLSVSLSLSLVRLALVLGGGAQLTVRVGNEKIYKIFEYYLNLFCPSTMWSPSMQLLPSTADLHTFPVFPLRATVPDCAQWF